jgi:hypothetical protein
MRIGELFDLRSWHLDGFHDLELVSVAGRLGLQFAFCSFAHGGTFEAEEVVGSSSSLPKFSKFSPNISISRTILSAAAYTRKNATHTMSDRTFARL